MSRPERFDLTAARPLTTAGPDVSPAAAPAPRTAACDACPEELRCPLRLLGRGLSRWLCGADDA